MVHLQRTPSKWWLLPTSPSPPPFICLPSSHIIRVSWTSFCFMSAQKFCLTWYLHSFSSTGRDQDENLTCFIKSMKWAINIRISYQIKVIKLWEDGVFCHMNCKVWYVLILWSSIPNSLNWRDIWVRDDCSDHDTVYTKENKLSLPLLLSWVTSSVFHPLPICILSVCVLCFS